MKLYILIIWGEAKRFFYEKMIDMDVNQLEEVYTKITQHFLFNMYIISDDIDVYVTFETMNNRGKPLSNLELLKNRLIYVSTLLNVADADKSRLRRDINECWKKIYHILGKSKERVLLDDEFLVTHFMLYFAKNIDELEKESYYDHLGQWQSNYLLNDYFVVQKIFDKSLTIEDCFNYIQSLSECIDFWGDIKNPLSSKYDDEIKEYIDKINFFSIRRRFYRSRYMIDFSYLNVFLLACFRACNNNNKTLLNFLKILEKYLFSIEFYDGEAIEELCINLFNFAEAVVKLNKGEWVIQGIIDKLKKLYEFLVNSTELNKKTVLYYSKNGFYRTSWLRYFLCEYEYSLMKKSKTNINKLNRWEIYERGYNSIEHIYPENSHNKYWIELFREYTSKQKNALKNSLGNFVAISSEKNGKLGNKSFPEKKSNTQNPVGYKYGTYAEIEIADYKDWDSMAILKRGLMLIAFLNERWGIRVGNGKKDDKYKFLGLQFLI